MEALLVIAGLVMLYATGHFFVLQRKAYKQRSTYEKVVTWVAIISIVLVYIGAMAG